MSVITDSGHIAFARAVMGQPVFLAWGTGEESWDVTPAAEDVNATQLVNEIGRKKVSRMLFVEEDPSGEIQISQDERYTVSDTPTNKIYFEFVYDYDDGGDADIRETAIFVGCRLNEDQPEGKTYFARADFADLGTMLTLQHLDKKHGLTTHMRGDYRLVVFF